MPHHKGPPTAEVTPTVLVMLQYEIPEEGDSIGTRFLEWCLKERICGLRVGSTGPGWVHNAYHARDAERIKKWFAENSIKLKCSGCKAGCYECRPHFRDGAHEDD